MAHTMKEVAETLGISVPLIRRYEQEFDLSFQRNDQGRCVLSDTDVSNLRIILEKRAEEVPVDSIRTLLIQRSEPVFEDTALVTAESDLQPPGVREVMQAMLDRMDQLEQLVIAQGSAIQRLGEENLRLLESGVPASAGTDRHDERIRQLERDVQEARHPVRGRRGAGRSPARRNRPCLAGPISTGAAMVEVLDLKTWMRIESNPAGYILHDWTRMPRGATS